MPVLISPTSRLHSSFLAARDEWGVGAHQAGAGLHADDDVDSAAGFGAISLRHDLTDFLLRAGGQIGYGVRPSARRRGVASFALRSVLPEARRLGMQRVLVTCADDSYASARTIEKAGGVLDDVRDTELGRTRRYWIAL